jgi:hypothetical protein
VVAEEQVFVDASGEQIRGGWAIADARFLVLGAHVRSLPFEVLHVKSDQSLFESPSTLTIAWSRLLAGPVGQRGGRRLLILMLKLNRSQ